MDSYTKKWASLNLGTSIEQILVYEAENLLTDIIMHTCPEFVRPSQKRFYRDWMRRLKKWEKEKEKAQLVSEAPRGVGLKRARKKP